MNPRNRRAELLALSQSLLKLHKLLLDFQKNIQEKKDGKRFSPHELLHLVMHHPDFEWLRKISMLVVRIDEQLDDKEVTAELSSLLNDADCNPEFKNRLEEALQKNPNIALQVAELKKFL